MERIGQGPHNQPVAQPAHVAQTQTAAQPVQQPVAQPVAQPVQQPVAQPVQQPVAPVENPLANLGGIEQDNPNLKVAEAVPFLGFHSMRSERASDIIAALGNIPEGTPYLCIDGRYYNASGWAFQTLSELPFWAQFEKNPPWSMLQCSTKPQPFGSELQENILTVTLLLPGTSAIPAELGPAVATMTNWRSTKCPAVKAHYAAVKHAATSAWVQAGPGNGAIASAVRERFRVASQIVVESATSRKNGNVYYKARAVTQTINANQMTALQQWNASPQHQQQLAEVMSAYNRRKAELEGFQPAQPVS